MLMIISPAKTLDYESPLATETHTQPDFLDDACELIDQLKELEPHQVSNLMSISDKLGQLNAERFQTWHTPFTPDNARQAVLAFKGDVYTGLDAESFSSEDFSFAQKHLRILSGLYGLLKPLDLMQPYRLEMGTALPNARGNNLYKFWGRTIADHLQARLVDHPQPVIVNLASQEYFKAVDRKALQARVIECVFEERKGPGYKIISFMAKRARGLMARYAITQRVKTPAALEKFNLEGYAFAAAVSEPDRLVFRREAA